MRSPTQAAHFGAPYVGNRRVSNAQSRFVSAKNPSCGCALLITKRNCALLTLRLPIVMGAKMRGLSGAPQIYMGSHIFAGSSQKKIISCRFWQKKCGSFVARGPRRFGRFGGFTHGTALAFIDFQNFLRKKVPDPGSGDFGRRIFYPFASMNKRLGI